ncbi:MAG TPA: sulfatase [Myxococcota bacterium]|nr:sulfatase [Myxococcota bacterium]
MRAAAAGALGGAATGLAEGFYLMMRARFAGWRALGPALALDVLLGTALALAALAGVTLLLADARLRAALARLWADRAGPPEARARFAAAGLCALATAAAALAAGIPLVVLVAGVVADPANEPYLQVPAMLALAGLAVLVALPLQAALARALAPLARRLPRAVPWLPAAVAAAGVGGAAAFVLRNPAWRAAVDFPALASLAGCAALVAAAAALRPARALLAARPRAAAAAAAALVAAAALGLVPLSGPRGRAVLAAYGLASAFPLALLESATDRDRDGISPWFGGIDCDDHDPAVHAGAVDYPGDGRDQDCDGADSKPMVVDFGPERAPGVPAAARTARSVLLVTIDALRADHVGAYGYAARATTPRFDAFARTATRFVRVYSPGSATVRVMPAILSGVHPLAIRWKKAGKSVEMDTSHTTIAEVLAARGLATASVDLAQPAPRPGFEQGFADTFRKASVPLEVYNAGNAAASATKAMEWLDALPADPAGSGGKKPFFLWVHFIDPHHPYHPHAETAAFGDDDMALYDGEVAYADAQMGKLLDHLDALGLAATTLVVVTSDHGEQFGEHGEHYHAKEVWEESIRVPLAVRLPGAAPHAIATPVTTLDVAWTIYDLLGLPAGATAAARPRHGMSLAGAVVNGAEPPPRLLVAAAFDRPPDAVRRVAAVRWPTSVHEDTTTGARSCFDVAADPAQNVNVLDSRPACADVFAELAAWRVSVMGVKAPPPSRLTRPVRSAR